MNDLTTKQLKQFNIYSDLLIGWNQRFNLVSPTTLTSLTILKTKHFDDSLTYAEAIKFAGFDLNQSLSIADVGSGAGFPGIPLKIIYPHWQVTLIEATAKKCLFLEEVIKQLDLKNIIALNTRAENVLATFMAHQTQPKLDIILARAVAPLDKLTNWCLPLLTKEGVLITQKGLKELPLIEKFATENKHLKIKTLNHGEKVFVIINSD